ncbi:SDR family NAD(P)-dependent oxidoreductase [Microbacterium sp.]|uniref:SDR family NAD(P)-dependent oxidoreductase n=1 Tax=Microbacterium sp. TaxID=51671 RepID=UPI0039E699B3
MKPFDGRVALVTGAGAQRGIGRSTAVELAAQGARVVVSGRWHDYAPDAPWRGVHSVVEEIRAAGGEAVAIHADVASEASVEALVHETVQEWGGLDIVVNNAAARREGPVAASWELPLSEWQEQLDVNLTGVFLVCKAAIPHLLRRSNGRIVNVSSLSARIPLRQRAGYSASKHGLTGLTRVLAAELAPHAITVNAVCPGVIETDRSATSAQVTEAGAATKWSDFAASTVPAARVGSPEEVADLITFLASERAAYITGQAINIDGGWVMS